ncbi:MAG: hypothetical protein JOZ49_05220 [Mycolicibacterium sp.]|nr:hypothetical protein [Mycolicibacterium sp.]
MTMGLPGMNLHGLVEPITAAVADAMKPWLAVLNGIHTEQKRTNKLLEQLVNQSARGKQ